MIDAPSSTWFTVGPHWGWLIVTYFFVGGVAGGCYLLATLIDLFGRREDRPLARLGYYIAFLGVLVSGLLLSADLGRPMRFWHMLIESNTYRPMFKPWSPMSIGSWALTIFGLFTFLSFLAALAEDDRIRWPALRTIGARWPALRRLRAPSALGRVISVIGAIFGLYIAGYTGVLLAVTNRPIWSDTPLLGMLFVVSGTSTAAALMLLLAHRSGWTMPSLTNLHRMEAWVIVLELLVLVALLVSLGPVLIAWLNAWGVLLLLVVALGLVWPLVLSSRAPRSGQLNLARAAPLVLLGSFLLRLVIVFSSQAI
jgi:formate-dependent nitrite reductase membrane component NrfD